MKALALETIRGRFPDTHCFENLDSLVINAVPDTLSEILNFLKNDPALGFDLLLDVTAVDYLLYPGNHSSRFGVVYILRNWEKNGI